jgi:GAF domain-containing protein
LTAALVLVAVPTVFTVLAFELADWSWPPRLAVLLLWLVAAVVVTVTTATRERHADAILDTLAEAQATEDRERLERAVEWLLEEWLQRAPIGVPQGYEFTVYLHDSKRDVLAPWWPNDDAKVRELKSFRPGCGATGEAWKRGQTILVTDDAVSNAEYGLTPEQQEFFKDARAVVATPVSWNGRPVGVLTALSDVNDGYFEDEGAQERLRDIAALVGAAAVIADVGEV